jgi:casein kinase II subunit alpha
MGPDDVRRYIRGVLEALAFAHARGIMHRDVKPGNIMFNPDSGRVQLIDWGLAERYEPGSVYPTQVATGRYKGPELLLNYQQYGPSLDIWCLGVTFASILCQEVPLFRGKNTDGHIFAIASTLGGAELIRYAEKYGLDILPWRATLLGMKGTPWTDWRTPKNRHIMTDEAIDLLSKMMKVDPVERILAQDALRHPFLNPMNRL